MPQGFPQLLSTPQLELSIGGRKPRTSLQEGKITIHSPSWAFSLLPWTSVQPQSQLLRVLTAKMPMHLANSGEFQSSPADKRRLQH